MKIQINEEDAKRHLMLNPDRGVTMDTIELIKEAYTKVSDGARRHEVGNDEVGNDKVYVKAYKCGTIIRIDVKEGK